MNERFRELAKQQAGAILMDLVMPDSGMPERVKWNVGITTENLEKFAELIVAECVQVCSDRGAHHDGLYSAWADDCSKRIEKHFGVEE